MKIDFIHNKVSAIKLTDATLDNIITPFLISKYQYIEFEKSKKSKHPNKKKLNSYANFQFVSRAMNDWDTVGNIYHFHVTSKRPEIKDEFSIDMLDVLSILNWMCSDELIDSGDYLVEVVQYL